MDDGADGVKANFGNNPDKGDDHDDILCYEEQDENPGDDAASVIQGVYLKWNSQHNDMGEKHYNPPRTMRIDSTVAMRT